MARKLRTEDFTLGPLWGPVADLRKYFGFMNKMAQWKFRDYIIDKVNKEHAQIRSKYKKDFFEHLCSYYFSEVVRSARMSLVRKGQYNPDEFIPEIEVRKYLKKESLSDDEFKRYLVDWVERKKPRIVDRYTEQYRNIISDFYAEELIKILK